MIVWRLLATRMCRPRFGHCYSLTIIVGNRKCSWVHNRSICMSFFSCSRWIRRSCALPTQMLGGLSWFAVPWAFASCLGLAARALIHDVRLFLWHLFPICINNLFFILAKVPNISEPIISFSNQCRFGGSRRCRRPYGQRGSSRNITCGIVRFPFNWMS